MKNRPPDYSHVIFWVLTIRKRELFKTNCRKLFHGGQE